LIFYQLQFRRPETQKPWRKLKYLSSKIEPVPGVKL
jgi:hypothetical protein